MKLFALFFSSYIFILSLAPGMKGFELLKIGKLMSHYEIHHQRNPDSTIMDFIQEHYFSSSVNYEKEHEEMPFKMNSSFTASVFIESKEQIEFEILSYHETASIQKTISKQSDYSFSSDYSIWNPPRI